MSDAYKTIDFESEGEFKDRGSKFIGYLFPIKTEEDFKARMIELRTAHLKARHHCSSFRLRDGLSRASDDGEPSGSAGKPIMNQLLSAELVNVGCIVVRYFGGTKLGVSGLINAYKTAAKLAIEQATIETKYKVKQVELKFDYAIMGALMDCLKYLELKISSKALEAQPALTLEIKESEVETAIIRIKAKMLNRSVSDIEEDTTVPHLDIIVIES